MKPKTIYLVLCLLGTILTYWQFLPWVVEHGLNLRLLVQELFVNRISAFFGMDVIMSAVTVVMFLRIESSRQRIKARWLPILALLTVGVSLALPLFLYMREAQQIALTGQKAASV